MNDHQPPDLDGLDEEEQCREVYAWAGLALYMAQVLEHGLVNVLLMARLSDPALSTEFSSTDDFFEHHFRLMTGRLISAVRLTVDVSSDLDAFFAEALRLRNFVVHRFFRERIELFGHQHGRAIMLDELADAVRRFEQLDAELERLALSPGAANGITEDRIAAKIDELKAAAQPAT